MKKTKKKSNLSFLIFFVLIGTVFFWPKGNNDLISGRYLEKYYREDNDLSDLKKNSPKSRKNIEVLLNLERAAIFFFAAIIIVLFIFIFFVLKGNKDIFTSFYSYFRRDEEYYLYNKLAKICEFNDFDFQKVGELAKFEGMEVDEILRGLAAISQYLNYFALQNQKNKAENKKLYFFHYDKDSDEKLGVFHQSFITLDEKEENKVLEKLVKKEEVDELIDKNRKDTDYRDFLTIDKKIDEIEKFNFFNGICDCFPCKDLVPFVKSLLFFLFFLDPMNRKEEKDDFCHFSLHNKINKLIEKKDLEKEYLTILNGINNDINSVVSQLENNKGHLIDINDDLYSINIRITENGDTRYIPDGIFISNLMDLYKKILLLNSDMVVTDYNKKPEVKKINDQTILKTKLFFCYFVYTVLQNYLLFLKKLMFIEHLKKGYQKEVERVKDGSLDFESYFAKLVEKRGAKDRLKDLLGSYLYGADE